MRFCSVTEERGGQQVRWIDDINLCMTECSINELCDGRKRGGQQVRWIDDINLCITECSINELCDGRKRRATSTQDR